MIIQDIYYYYYYMYMYVVVDGWQVLLLCTLTHAAHKTTGLPDPILLLYTELAGYSVINSSVG